MYNQDVDVLYQINGIKEGDYIYPGQKIIIPNKDVISYIVKENDTLEKISNKLKVPTENIIKNNKDIYLLPDQLIIYKESEY